MFLDIASTLEPDNPQHWLVHIVQEPYLYGCCEGSQVRTIADLHVVEITGHSRAVPNKLRWFNLKFFRAFGIYLHGTPPSANSFELSLSFSQALKLQHCWM